MVACTYPYLSSITYTRVLPGEAERARKRLDALLQTLRTIQMIPEVRLPSQAHLICLFGKAVF
jgi:hypothetical protein